MSDFDAMNAFAYGHAWSADWDEQYGVSPGSGETVALLAELSAGRWVLEFGVGTGRLALALRERGIAVHGVDNSSAMLEALRRKPGGDDLPVTFGDMTSTRVDGCFGVVVLAYSTIFALATQEAQLECFHNAARHLRSGGLFVLEAAAVHDLAALDGGCRVVQVGAGAVELSVQRVDVLNQEIRNCRVVIRDGELPRVHPAASRYCSPAELDLMAKLAGLDLQERWGGWQREPFTVSSPGHVSVYERP